MAIRRARMGKVKDHRQHQIQVATLPTIRAMSRCFEEYVNLAIADGNASEDTIATYRSRLKQFLSGKRIKQAVSSFTQKARFTGISQTPD